MQFCTRLRGWGIKLIFRGYYQVCKIAYLPLSGLLVMIAEIVLLPKGKILHQQGRNDNSCSSNFF